MDLGELQTRAIRTRIGLPGKVGASLYLRRSFGRSTLLAYGVVYKEAPDTTMRHNYKQHPIDQLACSHVRADGKTAWDQGVACASAQWPWPSHVRAAQANCPPWTCRSLDGHVAT